MFFPIAFPVEDRIGHGSHDATVVAVHDDRHIDIEFVNENGQHSVSHGVTLLQDDDPVTGGFCCWPGKEPSNGKPSLIKRIFG